MRKTVTIYTVGSCLKNPGRGGWAFIASVDDYEYEISGNDPSTTNNIMELTAVIESLKFLLDENVLVSGDLIKIYSDSQYVVKGITIWIHNWLKEKNPSKRQNWPLWQELWKLVQKIQIKCLLEFNWVKAHSTNTENNRVDEIARDRANEI